VTLAGRLIALGIVVPDADGQFDETDVYRVRLVQALLWAASQS
jgi:hypothetical protein